MTRRLRSTWLLLAFPIAAALGACSEDLQTGDTCPLLCPGQGLDIRDTVLDGVVVLDSNLVGFPFQGSEDPLLLAERTDTLDVRIVARFDSLTRVVTRPNGDGPEEILNIDTAYVQLFLRASELPTPSQWFIDAYDIWDSTHVDTIPSQSLPNFVPGRLIGTYQGDTAFTDTLRIRVPLDTAFLRTLLATPDRRLRIGFRVRAATSVQLRVNPTDIGNGPTLVYVSSAPDTNPTPDTLVYTRITAPTNSLTPKQPSALAGDLVDYNIVAQAPNQLTPNTLTVGGLPASRPYLRFNLPVWLTDTVGVLRAQLQLVQDAVGGASSGDSVRLDGHLILANNDGISLHRAATLLSSAGVFVASKWIIPSASDTVRLNINPLISQWRTTNTSRAQPTAILLRINFEGSTPTALRFHSSEAADPALRPRLRVSYIPGGILGQP